MNVGTIKGGGLTRVGSGGYFMNNSHVGHDCMVGDSVIFATSATLGGHCEIGDAVYIGGLSAVHQFTRIGPYVMVGGVCGVRDDVIPYGLVNGQYAVLESLNLIGMKRRKFTKQRLATVRAFYQKLFHGPGTFAERLEASRPLAGEDPAIAEILGFIGKGKRPLCLPAIEK
ncbi:acyl-ACP--UDP-N-acetylglucosamine O-acyltransferase [Bradyrhizobium diazoefficiens]